MNGTRLALCVDVFTYFRYHDICNIKITFQCKIFSLYLKKAGLASRNIVHLQKSFYVVSTSASIVYVKPIRSLLIQRTPAGSSFRLFA